MNSTNETKIEIIRGIKEKKLIVGIYHCLHYVQVHHESFLEFWCGWIDYNTFIINPKMIAHISGRKDNSINKNFRNHGFVGKRANSDIKKKACQYYNIRSLPDPSGWMIRCCEKFNQSSTEDDVKKIKFIENDKYTKKPITQNHFTIEVSEYGNNYDDLDDYFEYQSDSFYFD